jgi:SOS-response transcriptional repressor LexA
MESLAIRLKNARKKSGLTQIEAAKIAGVSDLTWRRIEEGTSVLDVNALEKFSLATSEDVIYLLTGKKDDERVIPVVDKIPAGPLTQSFGEAGVIGHVRTAVKDVEAFGLLVTGTSMIPEIQEEDIVICSPSMPFVNGKIYAIVVGEGEQSLKRVRHDTRSHAYALIPTNKEFPTLYVPEPQVIKLVRIAEVRRDLQ